MKPLKTKYARRPIAVSRDDHGVPHVSAPSLAEALYGLGYMHAIDRPTQMLFSRVVAGGRSAELIADRHELLETDRFFRRVGLHLRHEQEISHLDDESFRLVTAYCEGVNDGLKQAGRSLPMWATGFQPEPWNQHSVLLIGNLLNYGGLVVSQQQNERLLVELVQSGVDRQRLCELFEPMLDGADFELLQQIKIASRLSDEALELITDLPRLAGSNAWAVAPRRSASGHALLAGDPHLEVNRLPAIWYEVVLRWDGHYAVGATLPGCPLFAVARNRRVAWAVTYMKGDTSDFYIEDCRLDQHTWQYRRGDSWYDFAVRPEEILRKGGPTETLLVYENSIGTLETDPARYGPGLYLSVAWTGHSEGVGRSMATWLHMLECTSTRAALDIAADCPQPTLNWVVADVDGHIGRQGNGWFPRRAAGHSGLLPVPAWDPANHWQGILPKHVLPRVLDPPEGFVSSANESVNVPGGPMLVTQPLSDYRKRRIDERLAELDQATLADMQHLQYDVISVQARDLMQVFLPHLPDGELKEMLAAWDYNYAPESVEPTLFTLLYRNVLLEIFGQEPASHGGIGWRRMLYLCSRVGFSLMVVTCIDRLLKKEHSLWWHGRDKGDLIRRAAEKLSGVEPEPWAAFNAFTFTNRYIESRFVGRTLGFHTSELPMRGCHATPFQGHLLRAATRETTFAPSYHLVTDLGTDQVWTNLPGGAAESWLSGWYKNGIPLWLEGQYKPLPSDGGTAPAAPPPPPQQV